MELHDHIGKQVTVRSIWEGAGFTITGRLTGVHTREDVRFRFIDGTPLRRETTTTATIGGVDYTVDTWDLVDPA